MNNGQWQLTILDADPAYARDLGSLAVGDLDGDGQVEVITAGTNALLWHRPATGEKGVIDHGPVYQVGITLADLDGDGRLEIIIGDCDPPKHIFWFKPGETLDEPWTRYVIEDAAQGSPHDLLALDIDHDGELEIIANAIDAGPGLYIYKRQPDDLRKPWQKFVVQEGFFEEGLAAADLDGDGQIEIVAGPNLYHASAGGVYAGPWLQTNLAVGLREMCRTALFDITGNGRPDVVIVESEYVDGRLAWYENRTQEEPSHPWLEHAIADGFVFGHSLQVYPDPLHGAPTIFLAEMAQGGWNPPYNWDARLLTFKSRNQGQTWQRTLFYQGAGTHEAKLFDVDGDGWLEIIGKECFRPKLQLWKKVAQPSPLVHWQHRFLDRDKPNTATDIVTMDVDGDGLIDVVCGEWWYKNPGWERRAIPGIYQALLAYDLDGDGRQELIATRRKAGDTPNWYEALSSDLVWLKPIDPFQGEWAVYPIGTGQGDWPHGAVIGPLLPDGKLALVLGYHSCDKGDFPELFTVPADPRQGPWPRQQLAEIEYGEEFALADIAGHGRLDIVAGPWWLENLGDGRFTPHTIVENFYAARLRVADINGDGKLEVILGEEALDFQKKVAPHCRLAWFEQPADPRQGPWAMHVIDKVRCPHSLDLADLDGDGELEVICGEHDPFKPYRSRSRLLVYKKADMQARTWHTFLVDGRFEHHDGAKVIEVAPGRLGIISHGWADSRYVHLWEMV